MSANREEKQANPPESAKNEAPVTRFSTENGGEPAPCVDIAHSTGSAERAAEAPPPAADAPAELPVDAVAAALAGARQVARSRSPRRGGGIRRRQRAQDPASRGGYSGARPDDTDPQPLGKLLSGYVSERGWDRPLSEARVFSDWATLVGPDIATHCVPHSLTDGELRLSARSTAWATQLRLLQESLLTRLTSELGPGVVRRITISGPAGPSWKRGPRAVRGRGPRDTYG